VTFQCPECGSRVPSDEDGCPVCHVGFRAASLQDHLVYSCPRCGAQVDSEAVQCSCGVRFEA
jgi:DNA-directed RNA polymerase subunit RPC12/RpoP